MITERGAESYRYHMACMGYSRQYMPIDRCKETVQSFQNAGQLFLSHTHSAVLHAFYVNLERTVTTKQTTCAWTI